MRKRRAVVFEDDVVITGLLKMFLSLRGYELLSYNVPVECPIFFNKDNCDMMSPCADIMIVDYSLAGMSGLELIRSQANRKCKLPAKNKALLTGYFDTVDATAFSSLGCANFEKPLNFTELAQWFDACEERMDLTKPLGMIRKEKRLPCNVRVTFQTFHTVGVRKGVATNSSQSGLCLKITAPLRLHQTVTIRSLASPITQSASVRWIKPLGENTYLAGLQFQREEQGMLTTV